MPRKSVAADASRFYRQIGTHGWHRSDYFTYCDSSPALRDWIAERLPARRGRMTLLSVGCGTGKLESQLALPKRDVIGLDLSFAMLRRLARQPSVVPVQADAGSLPFAPGTFDVVLFMESIGHLTLANVFAEAARVLRKKGRIMVTTYSSQLGTQRHYRGYGFNDILPALTDAGFAVAESLYLNARRNAVSEAASEKRSTLLYADAIRR